MYPTKDIIQNAVNSKDHTTLVTAVKAAGLVDTLEGKGPFTVFAPTNEAFGKAAEGTVGALVKPENKAMLTKILTYHVVAGKMSGADLKKAVAGWKGQGGAQDRRRRTADRRGKGRQARTYRCERRNIDDHDRRCRSVQRGHPRCRHCADAELNFNSDKSREHRFPGISMCRPCSSKRPAIPRASGESVWRKTFREPGS